MPIPMEEPAKFAADIALRKVIRYGAILKNAETGQIVGHLKETGVMGDILGSFVQSPLKVASSVLNPVGAAIDVTGHVVNGVQIRNVQRSVDEVLSVVEGLELATNVAAISSVVGLGVSIAGFSVINKRLSKVENTLDRVAVDLAQVKAMLKDLSISWEAMSIAKFNAASETIVAAEKADTESRRQELVKEAASQFSILRHYYAHLLRTPELVTDNALETKPLYELISRYTVSCVGLLQAEFMTGDLGSYQSRLQSVLEEYPDLVTISPRAIYLSRCDRATELSLGFDHEGLAKDLISIAQASNENIARLESYQVELEYLVQNQLSVSEYLAALKNQETDLVVLPV